VVARNQVLIIASAPRQNTFVPAPAIVYGDLHAHQIDIEVTAHSVILNLERNVVHVDCLETCPRSGGCRRGFAGGGRRNKRQALNELAPTDSTSFEIVHQLAN
jgi:hypothetical protein